DPLPRSVGSFFCAGRARTNWHSHGECRMMLQGCPTLAPDSARSPFVREQRCFQALVILFLSSVGAQSRAGENWPQWRGANGNGTSDSTKLPTEWSLSANKNIVWKAPLPWWSGGTPVIWGDHVFVTSPTKSQMAAGAGKEEPGAKGQGPGEK